MSDGPLKPMSETHVSMLREAVLSYELSLAVDEKAQGYLHGRGMTDETIEKFRLGLVDRPAPGHGHSGWLCIPYLSAGGDPVQVRFRCIADHEHEGHGKYAGLAGEPTRMFNVGAIIRARDVIEVTEGEMDAMILEQAGFHAVAIPGVQNFKPHHAKALAGFSLIRVWGDPDEPGQKFIHELTQKMSRARGVQLDMGDVNETFLRGGADALHAIVND